MIKYLSIIVLIILSSCSEQPVTPLDIEKIEQISIEVDSNVQDSLMLFQIYGELAPDGYLDGKNSLTEEYGFQLKRVAGCEVEDGMVKNILKQNNAALSEMNRIYGDDWIIEFEKKTNYKLAIPFY